MFLLDTVTISESEKPERDNGLSNFLSTVHPDDLYISSISIGELHFGLNLLPAGRRRDSIEAWITTVEHTYAGRILSFDEEVARVWGGLRALVRHRGYTIDFSDLIIAAISLRYDLDVITRNTRDFLPTGCRIQNPWE